MSARFLIGDVFERLAELPDGSVDLVMTSPPFLALRSYLPDGHPDKAKEIGSEATPADFLDTLLALTAEWRRILAPHGSIVVELGDTYSGSGGAGGDYDADGLRDGQARFDGSASRSYGTGGRPRPARTGRRSQFEDPRYPGRSAQGSGGHGWPLDKSLCMIPQLYAASLAYGRNLLDPLAGPSPAGMWRIRNLKPWIRSNPPVGALGDKERPATSYITVATRVRDRYFDLDAVRTANPRAAEQHTVTARRKAPERGGARETNDVAVQNDLGAPPRDWWHQVDGVLDAELDRMADKPSCEPGELLELDGATRRAEPPRGARGVHLRRALERAGILTTADALDISPTGYSGAHYAVWPKELVRVLVDEMCPRRVCSTCGQPSRRQVEAEPSPYNGLPGIAERRSNGRSKGPLGPGSVGIKHDAEGRRARTVGWSDCGHDTWRPGLILDPFVGSGTTLEVASGMDRESIGIDLDERNAELARERVGIFLDVEEPTPPSDDREVA